MEKFFKLVDDAIALSVENRGKFDPIMLDRPSLGMEFCTVKISCGRGVGKTSYILERRRPWDMVIVPNERLKRLLYRLQGFQPHYRDRVLTIAELLDPNYGRGLRLSPPRNIYIDEGFNLSFEELHAIWSVVGAHSDQTMIVLG